MSRDDETLLHRWLPADDAMSRHHRAMTLGALASTLAAGASTGLLAALEEGGTAESLALRCRLDLRATSAVLELYAALGLTRVDGERHRLRDDFLDDAFGVPVGFLTAYWSGLETWLRSGRRPALYERDSSEQRGAVYRFAVRGLARLFEPLAATLAGELAARFEAPRRVLDVGAGSGVWSLAIAERHPAARVTAFDLPPVLDNFLTRAEELGLAARVDVVGGDLNETALPGGFDRVLLANVLHLEAEERARAWTRAATAALAPGGRLVVIDALPGARPLDHLRHAAYGVHLGMRTAAGRPHPEAALRAFMEDAGLTSIERVEIDRGGVAALVGLSADRAA